MNLFTTRDLREAAKKLAINSREYKRLASRSYRKYKNYINYKDVAIAIAAHLETIDLALSQGDKSHDPTWINTSHAMFGLYENLNFPVYALAEELLDAFMESTPPSKLWNMPVPFDRAVIVLPKGKLKNPDGLNVDWLIVDFINPKTLKQDCTKFVEYLRVKAQNSKCVIRNSQFDVETEELRLRWSTVIGYQYSYASIRALVKPGDESKLSIYDYLTPQSTE